MYYGFILDSRLAAYIHRSAKKGICSNIEEAYIRNWILRSAVCVCVRCVCVCVRGFPSAFKSTGSPKSRGSKYMKIQGYFKCFVRYMCAFSSVCVCVCGCATQLCQASGHPALTRVSFLGQLGQQHYAGSFYSTRY